MRRWLRAFLSATLHPECLENVKRVELWVCCELWALLPVMILPECLDNVKQAELWALWLFLAPSERSENVERAGLLVCRGLLGSS